MKFIALKYAAFFAFLVLIVSCKKDPVDDFKSKIVGDWKYEKIVEKQYTFAGKLTFEKTAMATNGEYYYFKKDGTAVQNAGFISNNTYKIISETRFELNTGLVNPCRVESITANTFIFTVEGPKRDQMDYTEMTHYLKK